MSFDSEQRYSHQRKEPHALSDALEDIEDDFVTADVRSETTKKTIISKQFMIFTMVTLVALSAVFIWVWVFEYFGMKAEHSAPLVMHSKEKLPLQLPPTVELTSAVQEIAPPAEQKVELKNDDMQVVKEVLAPMLQPTAMQKQEVKEISENASQKTEPTLTKKKRYTLQIVGLRKPANVKTFLSQASNKDKFQAYQTLHEGKPWYIIVYGEYNSWTEAQEALSALPENLKQHRPWIRKMKEVQEMTRAQT